MRVPRPGLCACPVSPALCHPIPLSPFPDRHRGDTIRDWARRGSLQGVSTPISSDTVYTAIIAGAPCCPTPRYISSKKNFSNTVNGNNPANPANDTSSLTPPQISMTPPVPTYRLSRPIRTRTSRCQAPRLVPLPPPALPPISLSPASLVCNLFGYSSPAIVTYQAKTMGGWVKSEAGVCYRAVYGHYTSVGGEPIQTATKNPQKQL